MSSTQIEKLAKTKMNSLNEFTKSFILLVYKPVFDATNRKYDKININLLVLHILFTLNTIIFAIHVLIDELNQKKSSDCIKYLNILSILFALLACILIIISELAINIVKLLSYKIKIYCFLFILIFYSTSSKLFFFKYNTSVGVLDLH